MKILYWVLAVIILLLSLWIFVSWYVTASIEKPKYSVVEKTPLYEIRKYDSYIVAEVDVSGDLNYASNNGFMIVADFIFGNNTSVTAINNSSEKADKKNSETKHSENIAMTSPVIIEQEKLGVETKNITKTPSEKIAMTAPVINTQEGQSKKLSFVMPADYTLETLPKPNNPEVSIREVPAQTVAVITFSGSFSGSRFDFYRDKLLDALKKDGLKYHSFSYAGYDPPLSFPWMRTNEVWAVLSDSVIK